MITPKIKLLIFIVKNKLLEVLLVMVLIMALISAGVEVRKRMQEIKPETLPRPSLPPSGQYSQKLTYTFDGVFPELQKSLKVYKINEPSTLTTSKVAAIGLAFDFTGEPKISPDRKGDLYRFKREAKTLVIYPEPIRVEYSDGSDHELMGSKATGMSIADWTLDFVSLESIIGNKFNLENPYVVPIMVSEYGEYSEAKALGEADMVRLLANISIDGVPIINRDRKDFPVEVIIELDGFVRKATVSLFSESLSSMGTVTLARPMDALAAINVGDGVIAQINDPTKTYTEIMPNDIRNVRLRNIELLYIYDEDDLVMHPYYRFSGTAMKKDEILLEVEVLITAVPEEFFKQ